MFQPDLAEQQDIFTLQKKETIFTAQLSWAMKWFIVLHRDIISVVRK